MAESLARRWLAVEEELARCLERRDLAGAAALVDHLSVLQVELEALSPGADAEAARLWTAVKAAHEANVARFRAWQGEVAAELDRAAAAREALAAPPGEGRWLDRSG
ncbi:MAG: hypothetical protein IRZ18_00415 [Clostridia bacterium]|nr:hypothetical protein [Clostridia bacterium]